MKKILYRVQSGDTVFSVSERFRASPLIVIKENSLSREPTAGDMLVITPATRLYAVQPGDGFYSVAEKFAVTESELKRKNGDLPYLFYGLKIEV